MTFEDDSIYRSPRDLSPDSGGPAGGILPPEARYGFLSKIFNF